MPARRTWFRRSPTPARRAPTDRTDAHPDPVQIDLGPVPPLQVEIVLADLRDRGLRVQPPGLLAHGMEGAAGRAATVLVHPDDVGAVRAALGEAGLL